ncbi:MAG TPA: ergothioneine biosynthesis protein EgtC [Acidimicrobiales bacterium]
MCRHLAYLGPPTTLASVVLDPPHSLERQAFAPKEQRHSPVNADGFGVGWWVPAVRAEPAVYRNDTPIWADRSFPSIAGVISASAMVAAVRSATPPNPVEVSGVAPFAHEQWLFSLNGWIDGVWEGRGTELRRSLPPGLDARIRSASDGDLMFSLVLAALPTGADLADAVGRVVASLAVENPKGPLNVLLSDGHSIIATAAGNSLHIRSSPGSVIVASEPLDERSGWMPVPDHSLVVATVDGATITALSSPP